MLRCLFSLSAWQICNEKSDIHKQGNRKGQDTQKNVSEIVCLEECQGLTTALKEGIDIYVNYKTTISTIFNWNLSNDETAIMDRPCQKNC